MKTPMRLAVVSTVTRPHACPAACRSALTTPLTLRSAIAQALCPRPSAPGVPQALKKHICTHKRKHEQKTSCTVSRSTNMRK